MMKRSVVSYSKAVLNQSSIRNFEMCKMLRNDKFAKNGEAMASHAVFTVPSNIFTSSPNQTCFYPDDKISAQDKVRIMMFQLFARVGEDALTKPEGDEDEEEEEEAPHEEVSLNAPAKPKIVYRDNGYLALKDEDQLAFNEMELHEQEEYVQKNGYTILDDEEAYDNDWQEYLENLESFNEIVGKKGFFHVVLEYLSCKENPSKTFAYRFWILQEEGAKGNISKLFARRIASTTNDKKKKYQRKKKQERTYYEQWKNITNNGKFAEYVGNSLYCNHKHFDINKAKKTILWKKENPVQPEHVFNVGQWEQIIHGIDESGNSVSHLPSLYPNMDADPDCFNYTNYFDQHCHIFRPKEKFRNNMILLSSQDLKEGIFMEKHRPDIWAKTILPMIQAHNTELLKPKPVPSGPSRNLPMSIADHDAFKKSVIKPRKDSHLVGLSESFKNPNNGIFDYADSGKLLLPGESNSFFFQRALAHEFLLPYFTNLLKYARSCAERKTARIKVMRRALAYAEPIFASGDSNVGDGLRGIINTPERLKRNFKFSQLFVKFENLRNDLGFQDNFMAWFLDGAQKYLYLSYLGPYFYKLYMNVACAYMLIKDKTHVSQSGDPGTGKSELLDQLTQTKCPGVCKVESNASAMAHFFGDDICFHIKVRNEPDGYRDGGAAVKGNLNAQRATELEKTARSEQEGIKSISEFDAQLNRYVKRDIHVYLSAVIVENTNQDTKKREAARNDRDNLSHIPKCTLTHNTVADMKSAQSNQDTNRQFECSVFKNTLHYLDHELGKVSAMTDFDGGLTEANFAAFDDVLEYLQNHIDANPRSVERCRNTCRAQVFYDAIIILFHHEPPKKKLQFYIGQERVCSSLNKHLQERYNEDCTNFQYEHNCKLYRDLQTSLLHSKQDLSETREEVNCVIDLVNGLVYSKDMTVIDEDTKKPRLILEDQTLTRKWIFKKLWNKTSKYKVGDRCRIHTPGSETANYASTVSHYECLVDNKGMDPSKDSEHWKLIDKQVESLLGKYYQQEIEYVGDKAVEMWLDIDRLLYCTVDIAVRTFALMRVEFAPQSRDKINHEIVKLGQTRLMNLDSRPWKMFLPLRDDIRELQHEDIDLNYILIDSERNLKLKLVENLKQKSGQGIVVYTSDTVLNHAIDSLCKEKLASNYYPKFKNNEYPHIVDEQWQLPFQKENLINMRNNKLKERKEKPEKRPVMIRKRAGQTINVYMLVSFIDDYLHDLNGKESNDRYLSLLRKYKYYSPKEEKKKILISEGWGGKVKKKKKNGELYDSSEFLPSISSYITIEGSPNKLQVFREKNVVTKSSHLIHGRKRKKVSARRDRVDVHFDDYAMKLRLRQLDDYEGEDKDLDEEGKKKFFKSYLAAYSKREMKKELNKVQEAILPYDYPDEFAQQMVDER